MSLDVEQIETDARTQTGLEDTGGDYYREGLERLVTSMNEEGDLTELGEIMQQARLTAMQRTSYRQMAAFGLFGEGWLARLDRRRTKALEFMALEEPLSRR